MRKLLFLLSLLPSCALADFSACGEHLPYGAPHVSTIDSTTEVCHKGYASLVDDQKLVPLIVAYHLTGQHTLGCLERGNNFHVDENLTALHHAVPADYAHSGYDIGHQAPAADFAWDKDEMSDSFSLANMAPQLPGLNRQGWEFGEATVRAYALQRGDLQIYVGPIMKAGDKTIGKDQVDVPDAFYKIVLDNKTHEFVTWIMRQEDVKKGDLSPYISSLAAIQQLTGIVFPLPADAKESPTLWPADLTAWSKAHSEACHAK